LRNRTQITGFKSSVKSLDGKKAGMVFPLLVSLVQKFAYTDLMSARAFSQLPTQTRSPALKT
jgi:hypothetical protein